MTTVTAAAPPGTPASLFTKAGQPLHLRRPRVADAAQICAYIAHPEVYSSLLQLPHPSIDMWEERLKTPMPDSFSLAAVVTTDAGEQVVAMAGLFPDRAGMRRRHVLHLGMSVAVPFHGQGIGNALMTELLSYADNWAQCLRVELEVFTDNPRAIALYQKHGFQIEGTKRADALRNGAYVASHIMGRLNPKAGVLLSVFN